MKKVKRYISLLVAIAMLVGLVSVRSSNVEASPEEATSGSVSGNNNDDTVIGEITGTYAVLEGKIKVTGSVDFAASPTLALRICGEDSWGTDTFRLVYSEGNNSKIELGGYETDKKTVDSIEVSKVQNKGTATGLEKVFDAGLDIRLVRVNNWAYLYAKTGDQYVLVGKRDVTKDAPTTFALSSKNIGDATYEMTNILTDKGRKAALAAMDGKINLDENPIYIPVDSYSWTLEGTMHSNKDDWWQAWPNPSRIIAAGSNNGENTISVTMFENWSWFAASPGLQKRPNAQLPNDIVNASPENKAGTRLRWVREENMLHFYVYRETGWKEYLKIDTLSADEEGMYLLTRIKTKTNLSDIKLTVNEPDKAYEPNCPSIENQANGDTAVIKELNSTYAVLDGRIRLSGNVNFAENPTFALRVGGEEDTFRLVYSDGNASKVELGGYDSEGKTVDNIDVSKVQSQGTATGLEKALSYGLDIRLVRVNTWAYLYAKTGDQYVLVGKRDVTADAPTTFALSSNNIGAATYKLTDIRVVEGKEAALAAMDGKINLDENPIYIPVDSYSWTLEGTMHSNKGDWSVGWPTPSRIIAAGSNNGENTISVTMFNNWGWFAASPGLQKGPNAELPWAIVDASPENKAGTRIRWVREENLLTFYAYHEEEWKRYLQIDTLSADEEGLYLLTRIKTKTNLSDIKLTINEAQEDDPDVPALKEQTNGNDKDIYRTKNTYAVLEGRIKVSGLRNFAEAPALALRICGEDSWGKDTFRLVYLSKNDSKVELGGYDRRSSDVKTVDNIDVSKDQNQGTNTGLEKALSYGLDIRLVRMNSWAYLYAKTGDKYVLVGKRDVTADAPTTFALSSKDIGSATYEMTNIHIKEGRDSALQAMVTDGKINLDNNPIYIPLNSTDWTLEATMFSSSEPGWNTLSIPHRIIRVGSDTEVNTINMTMNPNWQWFYAEKGISTGGNTIKWSHVAAAHNAGIKMRWERQGDTLSFYIYESDEWKLYQQINSLDDDNTGVYLFTEIATNTNLSNLSLTARNTVIPGQSGVALVRYSPEIFQHPLADLTSTVTTAGTAGNKAPTGSSSTSPITGDSLGVWILVLAVLLLSASRVAVRTVRRRRMQR